MQRRNPIQPTILSLFSLLLWHLSVAACGSVGEPDNPGDHRADAEPTDDDGDGGGDPDDDEAPAILGVSPEPGSIVTEDFSVVITFSEPMDADAVESAVGLPARADPVFTWNLAGDELTLEPRAAYPTSEGAGRRALEVVVGAGAADRAGNPLASEQAYEFTLKYTRLQAVLPFSQTLSGLCYSTGCGSYTFVMAGERESNPTDTARGFLTFPFDLPDGVVVDHAVLNSEIELVVGNPFEDLGSLWVEDLQFSEISLYSFNQTASPIGVWIQADSSPTVGTAASIDVTSSVRADYQYRVQRGFKTQFRLRFPFDDPNDPAFAAHHADGAQDVVKLLRPSTNVAITYLVD